MMAAVCISAQLNDIMVVWAAMRIEQSYDHIMLHEYAAEFWTSHLVPHPAVLSWPAVYWLKASFQLILIIGL